MGNTLNTFRVVTKSETVTTVNVEIDQRTTFEGAMKLFRREVNNSNVVNEMKRRRYHEEAWMMRRRKEKERSMKVKALINITTFDDKNPLADNSFFDTELYENHMLFGSAKNRKFISNLKKK